MLLFEQKTEIILSCFYKVYNKLGYGFLEKVYENALIVELKNNGLVCVQQKPIKVYYENTEVGLYFSDLVVDDEIILEIKAGNGEILQQHILQLQNYLRATKYELGLVLYFGEKLSFKRKIFTNNLK
ncbi:MAG: GxxExxY protein [Ferruginibacter sp.]